MIFKHREILISIFPEVGKAQSLKPQPNRIMLDITSQQARVRRAVNSSGAIPLSFREEETQIQREEALCQRLNVD